MKKPLYLGVVGQIAAGKEVLAQYLAEKYGFKNFSLSTIIHLELKKRKIRFFTRETLQDMGNRLRERYGEDILAKRAVKILQKDNQPAVITGIRNPAEVKFLKRLKNFVLIAVKAKRKIRFQRILSRGKPWDPKTWEEFLKVDRRDLGLGEKKSGQQAGECIKMADYVLTNNSSLESFYKKIEKIIKKILNSKAPNSKHHAPNIF